MSKDESTLKSLLKEFPFFKNLQHRTNAIAQHRQEQDFNEPISILEDDTKVVVTSGCPILFASYNNTYLSHPSKFDPDKAAAGHQAIRLRLWGQSIFCIQGGIQPWNSVAFSEQETLGQVILRLMRVFRDGTTYFPMTFGRSSHYPSGFWIPAPNNILVITQHCFELQDVPTDCYPIPTPPERLLQWTQTETLIRVFKIPPNRQVDFHTGIMQAYNSPPSEN